MRGNNSRDRNSRGGRQKASRDQDDIKDKVVAINRVSKVTKGGRTFSFSAIVVVGDENGQVGHGLGKAREVIDAIQKGKETAIKGMIRVPLKDGTIPHRVHGKFGAGKVLIQPASKGTGLIAGGAMRAVLENAGVKDCIAKSLGSSNPHNVIKATINALGNLRDAYTVSKQRGISLDKVFTGK